MNLIGVLINFVILVVILWLFLYVIEWAVKKLGMPEPVIVIARVLAGLYLLLAIVEMLGFATTPYGFRIVHY